MEYFQGYSRYFAGMFLHNSASVYYVWYFCKRRLSTFALPIIIFLFCFRMKKWTTSTRVALPATSMTTRSNTDDHEGVGVSLLRVLQVRRKPLNEIEVWSLLGQAGNALKGQGQGQQGLQGQKGQKGRLVTPRSTICTPSGRVALQGEAVTESYYVHPRLAGEKELTEQEAEAASVFSLARTAEWALDYGEDELNR